MTLIPLLLLFTSLPHSSENLSHGGQSESRHFLLHKFMQKIGEETDTITTGNSKRTTSVKFKFTDRNVAVPLDASLMTTLDLHPLSMTLKGKVARDAAIDLTVEVNGLKATIARDKVTTTESLKPGTCAVAGYSPVAFQENLIRSWIAQGRPRDLATVPYGNVQIRQTATDELKLAGKNLSLPRFAIRGLVWGLETAWTDANGHLVALATRDAEFDHFEAIADDYEPLLPQFAGLAGTDSMAELARLSKGSVSKTSRLVALVGGRLFDGENVIDDSVVLIKGEKILAAGPRATTPIPPKCQRINVTGKTVMPGLWDMHAHFEQAEWGPTYLAAGVTTVRDCGNVFEFITKVRDAIQAQKGIGPRMILAGLVDGDSRRALGVNRVNSPEDAKAQVLRFHNAGFAQMKIYSSMKEANVRAVCEEAHKLGMSVTGHIPNGMTLEAGIKAGMDQVNHIQYLYEYFLPVEKEPTSDDEAIALFGAFNPNSEEVKRKAAYLRQHGTVFDPTMVIFELGQHDPSIKPEVMEPGLTKLPVELKPALLALSAGGDKFQVAIFELGLKILRVLHTAGIPVVAGTDQAVPGHSIHRELELYVQAGFTPKEALQAATTVPAKVMGLQNETGAIKAGLSADVIVVDGNPLENISDSRKVRMVFARGRLFDPARLWRLVGFTP